MIEMTDERLAKMGFTREEWERHENVMTQIREANTQRVKDHQLYAGATQSKISGWEREISRLEAEIKRHKDWFIRQYREYEDGQWLRVTFPNGSSHEIEIVGATFRFNDVNHESEIHYRYQYRGKVGKVAQRRIHDLPFSLLAFSDVEEIGPHIYKED